MKSASSESFNRSRASAFFLMEEQEVEDRFHDEWIIQRKAIVEVNSIERIHSDQESSDRNTSN